MPERTFDALIIGGGPAGATAGLMLARAGWHVAILERKVFPRRKVCGEYLSGTNLPLLRQLGLEEEFDERSGPAVTHVGLFARDVTLRAELPQPRKGTWGRALGREHLDSLLLERAVAAGAVLYQPWSPEEWRRDGEVYGCRARSLREDQEQELRAQVIIAAHGSWESGSLITQQFDKSPRPSDLFGFKAHFSAAALADGLMPLVAFPDGYGGLVHSDSGRVSFSCCIRRDRLARLRRARGKSTAEAVFAHIMDSCRGVRQALEGAEPVGGWLAAGPLRTGMRLQSPPGIFRVGNAIGEAHPVVAEGISMAMQGAWLLAKLLQSWRAEGAKARHLPAVQAEYVRLWKKGFAPRLRTAALVAHWAMRPAAVAMSLPMLKSFPNLLTWGARLSGKANLLVRGS